MDEILASIRKIIDAGETQSRPPVDEAPEVSVTVPPSPANDPGSDRPLAPPSLLPQQPLTRRTQHPDNVMAAAPVSEAKSDIAAAVSDYLAQETQARMPQPAKRADVQTETNESEPVMESVPDVETAFETVSSADATDMAEISDAKEALLADFSAVDRDILADRRTKYDARFSEADDGAFRKVGSLLRETVEPSVAGNSPLPEERGATALVSDTVSQSVSQSLASLSGMIPRKQGPDLDAMAEEMLRPLLQDWLDNNLPSLVERLVRAEIERIARGEPRTA